MTASAPLRKGLGPRTVPQLNESLAGFELTLPEDALICLETISGPPPAAVTGSAARPWLRGGA